MPGDRLFKCAGIDADLLGQFPERGGFDQVVRFDEWPQILGPRMHDANAVVANKTPVTDQVGGHARGGFIGAKHRHYEIMGRNWDLFTKRRPDLFTATRPAFERSRIMCG